MTGRDVFGYDMIGTISNMILSSLGFCQNLDSVWYVTLQPHGTNVSANERGLV